MFLLDTNAISEVLKKSPDPGFMENLRVHEFEGLATSVVCVFELRHGCRRHPRSGDLWQRIHATILSRLEILPFGMGEALCAGDIHASLMARGTPIGIEDVWIGATALIHERRLVTRNDVHLGRIEGLRLARWWA